jgi:hypothetical protein
MTTELGSQAGGKQFEYYSRLAKLLKENALLH